MDPLVQLYKPAEVDALRGLLIGTHAHLWLDAVVLAGALMTGVVVAAAVLPRLVR